MNNTVWFILAGIVLVWLFARWLSGEAQKADNRRTNRRNVEKWRIQDGVREDRNLRRIRDDQARHRTERHQRQRDMETTRKKNEHDAQRRAAQDMAKFQREHPEPQWAKELRNRKGMK